MCQLEKDSSLIRSLSMLFEEALIWFSPILNYSFIRRSFLAFFQCGYIPNPSMVKRKIATIISEKENQLMMQKWMNQRVSETPPPTARDFPSFVNTYFNCNISSRLAQLWLNELGYKYRSTSIMEMYDDGRQREDVQQGLHHNSRG